MSGSKKIISSKVLLQGFAKVLLCLFLTGRFISHQSWAKENKPSSPKSIKKSVKETPTPKPSPDPKLPELKYKDTTCLTSGCHGEIKKRPILHNPLTTDECTVCHEVETSSAEAKSDKLPGKHPVLKKLSQEDKVTLCVNCHGDVVKNTSANFHNMSQMEKGCLTCHESHPKEKNPKLLKNPSTEETCRSCHDSSISPAIYPTKPVSLHEPYKSGNCTECHKVHGSDVEFTLKSQPTELAFCQDCHALDLKATTDNSTEFRNGSQSLHSFHIVGIKKNYNCKTCHEVHWSTQNSLIKKEFKIRGTVMPIQFKKEEDGGSCATVCHRVKRYNRTEAVKNVSDQ